MTSAIPVQTPIQARSKSGHACHNSPLALIDHTAIRHNLNRLRQLLAYPKTLPTPLIWAVAKADAYGHTLEHAYAGLCEADGLAVLTLDEARHCRSLGWTGPILAMSAQITQAALEDPILYPLHLIIDHQEQLAAIQSLRPPFSPHVWLRYRGRLNHAGFDQAGYKSAYASLQSGLRDGRLAELGHLQHYATAEEAEPMLAERQAFQLLIEGLPGPVCTDNSAALLSDHSGAALTSWVRSGIALYGISPLAGLNGKDLGLRPAMVLQAPLYGFQTLQAGDSLGYGSTFLASRKTRVGLVRCGYAHGYPRSIPEGCEVMVTGRMATIIGRVSMDTLTIDLTDHPDAGYGTVVTLWGTPELPIEVVAAQANTIPAQLCTALTERVPRQSVS
ncbi:alanine racemase, catabolic [Pusillimonas sp. T7-7]|uniref:alanine racemase n=1 Tax=Pusillimonas sp. (strain T7-7) TaxID=1007105 RepID=UPI000208520B|nr:alanine racemase [Pusillimonas sp. T7-7]AEC21901.1 alanine racemase, catabolic [Pusillimonas sp. T7-7]